MIFLGLIILLVAIGAGVLLVLGTQPLTTPVKLDTLGPTVEISPLELLIAGAALVLLLWLGLALLRAGLRRSSRKRKEAKLAEQEAETARVERERRMQDEFAQRERALTDERRAREEETSRLRSEADERVREEHRATETARERAEIAEGRLADSPDRGVGDSPDRGGSTQA